MWSEPSQRVSYVCCSGVSCDQCEYKNLIKFIMRYHDNSHHHCHLAGYMPPDDGWIKTFINLITTNHFIFHHHQHPVNQSNIRASSWPRLGWLLMLFWSSQRNKHYKIDDLYHNNLAQMWRRLERVDCIIGLELYHYYHALDTTGKKWYNYRN